MRCHKNVKAWLSHGANTRRLQVCAWFVSIPSSPSFFLLSRSDIQRDSFTLYHTVSQDREIRIAINH